MKQETSCYLPNDVRMSIPKWHNQTLSIIHKHYQRYGEFKETGPSISRQSQTEKITNEERNALFKAFRRMSILIEQNTVLLKYRQGPEIGEVSITRVY